MLIDPPPSADEAPSEKPIYPMLAKVAERLPDEGDFLFEPKWDGFRAIVFKERGAVRIQSRDAKSLDRYFPELHAVFDDLLPDGCVLDGEIVIATPDGLDFDALQQRVHPAASRVARLAQETPASFVAFDLLCLSGEDLMARPLAERRLLLEALLSDAGAPLHLTPMTTDRALAERWLSHFEGAGLDGVMAKLADQAYLPGKRAMFKIKHVRTADCVVAGLRWHKTSGAGGADDKVVGSLLLGLYDATGVLQHVGMTSSFTMEKRRALAIELAPLMSDAIDGHPWADWSTDANDDTRRMPGAQSRWSSGKDLSWQPLRVERVCEVKYDHLQGDRFRHGTTFLHWRFDKPPASCTYEQLEVTPPYELARVFAA